MPNFDFSCRRRKHIFFWKAPLRSKPLFASTQKVHRPRSQSPLHFDTEIIQQIRSLKLLSSARRLLPAALLECWPQVCRVRTTLTLLQTDCFVSTMMFSMEHLVHWISLRIRVRSKNTQPRLKLEK